MTVVSVNEAAELPKKKHTQMKKKHKSLKLEHRRESERERTSRRRGLLK